MSDDRGDAISGEGQDTEQTPAAEDREEPTRPALRIVRGEPTPEELAALTIVLVAAAGGGGGHGPAGPTSTWSAPTRRDRHRVHPGPNGWRASAFPG